LTFAGFGSLPARLILPFPAPFFFAGGFYRSLISQRFHNFQASDFASIFYKKDDLGPSYTKQWGTATRPVIRLKNTRFELDI